MIATIVVAEQCDIASIKIHKAHGAGNVRYGNAVPESVSSKMVNQYACGTIHTGVLDSTDKRYKILAVIEKENGICNSDIQHGFLV